MTRLDAEALAALEALQRPFGASNRWFHGANDRARLDRRESYLVVAYDDARESAVAYLPEMNDLDAAFIALAPEMREAIDALVARVRELEAEVHHLAVRSMGEDA